MAPVSQQAVPAVQPVAQPAIAAAPVTAAPMAAAPAVGAPMGAQATYAPMAATPLPAGGTTPMMWAAVGCIVFALMLSMAGQFSHSWIVDNENEGSSFGLTTVRVDCSMAEGDSSVNVSKEAAVDQCKVTAYTFYAEDMEAASSENNTADDIDDVIVGDIEDVCENTYKIGAAFATGNETLMADLAESRDTCLETPAAGSTGGLVLWLGSVAALLGTLMLSAGSIGSSLPAQAEKHGKWAGMAAGVLMLLAVLVWWLLLPDTDTDTSAGMGVWMTVLGGVLAIVAGVLAFMDQK